jgi:hypothetical protein
MRRWQMTAVGASLFVLLILFGGGGASARPGAQTANSTDWLSLGNTLDQMRH